MKIGAPKEVFEGEARVAMTPDSATQLQKLGHECFVETGAVAVQTTGQIAKLDGVAMRATAHFTR